MLYSFKLTSPKNPSQIPTALKLTYHFEDDFLIIYENYKFDVLNEYFKIQNNSLNFNFMFPKMIQANPNRIMHALNSYSNTGKILNTDFLESLNMTLKHINKDSISLGLLFGLHISINSALEAIDSKHKKSELLKQCYETLKQVLGENHCEQIASYNRKIQTLKKLR